MEISQILKKVRQKIDEKGEDTPITYNDLATLLNEMIKEEQEAEDKWNKPIILENFIV